MRGLCLHVWGILLKHGEAWGLLTLINMTSNKEKIKRQHFYRCLGSKSPKKAPWIFVVLQLFTGGEKRKEKRFESFWLFRSFYYWDLSFSPIDKSGNLTHPPLLLSSHKYYLLYFNEFVCNKQILNHHHQHILVLFDFNAWNFSCQSPCCQFVLDLALNYIKLFWMCCFTLRWTRTCYIRTWRAF